MSFQLEYEGDYECHQRTSQFFFILPSQPCLICGKPTAFVEISFETHLCPDFCADLMTLEYAEAVNRSGGHPPPKLQEVI